MRGGVEESRILGEKKSTRNSLPFLPLGAWSVLVERCTFSLAKHVSTLSLFLSPRPRKSLKKPQLGPSGGVPSSTRLLLIIRRQTPQETFDSEACRRTV